MTLNINSPELRQQTIEILGNVPNPVAIVTLRVDGRPWGVTVSSFLPVTMDPPKVLVSLFHHTLAARQILRDGAFGVSLLSIDLQAVAESSSRPGSPKFMESFCGELDSFEDHAYGVSASLTDHFDSPLDPPRVSGASHFQCLLDRHVLVDDHVLLIGRVTVATVEARKQPLLYVNRSFAQLSETKAG